VLETFSRALALPDTRRLYRIHLLTGVSTSPSRALVRSCHGDPNRFSSVHEDAEASTRR